MKGSLDVLLLGLVLGAAAVRTPLGPLTGAVVDLVLGRPVSVDWRGPFSTAPAARIHATAGALGPPVAAAAAEPSLLRVARLHLGPAAAAAAAGADGRRGLLVWAVGAPALDRAERRARAAGAGDAPGPDALRRFVPAERRPALDGVAEVFALARVDALVWPVAAETRVSSPFGWRTHPTLGHRKHHDGVDLALPVGAPVGAAGDGRVRRAAFDPVCGNGVVIDHGDEVRTSYCHGSALPVRPGAAVQAGDVVLRVGSTGRSTGPHLHFGLRIRGRAVDPAVLRRTIGAPAG